jgi:hypothetical protein
MMLTFQSQGCERMCIQTGGCCRSSVVVPEVSSWNISVWSHMCTALEGELVVSVWVANQIQAAVWHLLN